MRVPRGRSARWLPALVIAAATLACWGSPLWAPTVRLAVRPRALPSFGIHGGAIALGRSSSVAPPPISSAPIRRPLGSNAYRDPTKAEGLPIPSLPSVIAAFAAVTGVAIRIASKNMRNGSALRQFAAPDSSPGNLQFAVFAVQKPQRRRAQRANGGSSQVEALDIKIRPMELRDTGPCFYLGEKLFKAGNLYRTWDEWEPVTSLSSSPEYCFVAEVGNGRVVGFVLGSVVHKKSVSIGYIDWIIVDRAFQRLGIGTKLVTKALNVMREEEGITTIMADTPAENNAAVDFFMKHLSFTERIPHVYLARAEARRAPVSNTHVDGEQVVVRRLIVDDLFKIHQLGEKVFNSHANLFRMWDENEVMDMFSQNSDHCLVATIRGAVAGFCLGTTVDKRRNKEPYGYLIWLGVDGAFGRRGIGTSLIRAFEELMANQGVTQIFVDTQADNDAAIKFFEAQGFGDTRMHVYMAKSLEADPSFATPPSLEVSSTSP